METDLRQLCLTLVCLALLLTLHAQDSDDLIHTVEAGETLISIANDYGVTLEQLLSLNSLDIDAYLQIGQRLLVIPDATLAESAGVDADEADSEAESDDAFVTVRDPDAPVTVASAPMLDPADLSPEICFVIFADDNYNGMREPVETRLGGGEIILFDAADIEQLHYTTDGKSEPYCVRDLGRRRYRLEAVAPEGYGVSGAASLWLDLRAGGKLTLEFSARGGLARPATAPLEPIADRESETRGASDGLLFGSERSRSYSLGWRRVYQRHDRRILSAGPLMPRFRDSLWRRRFSSWLLIGIVTCLCASSLAQDTGQICLRAYIDLNEDGLRADIEGPIARGIAASLLNERGVTISSQLLEDSAYAGDGLLCFDQLLAGDYRVIVSSSEYVATGTKEAEASVRPGTAPALFDFGAKALAVAASPSIITGLAALDGDTLRAVAVAAGAAGAAIIFMSLLGCAIVVVLLRRRRRRRALQLEDRAERDVAFRPPAETETLAPRLTKDPSEGSPPLFTDEDQEW